MLGQSAALEIVEADFDDVLAARPCGGRGLGPVAPPRTTSTRSPASARRRARERQRLEQRQLAGVRQLTWRSHRAGDDHALVGRLHELDRDLRVEQDSPPPSASPSGPLSTSRVPRPANANGAEVRIRDRAIGADRELAGQVLDAEDRDRELIARRDLGCRLRRRDSREPDQHPGDEMDTVNVLRSHN